MTTSKENGMENYNEVVKRTAKSCPTQEVDGPTLDLLHWALGISGEAGEIVDPIKKHVFYNQKLDITNLQEEIGDMFYYLEALCETLGLDSDYVKLLNKQKLEQRYP